jgi:hypothetical protein
VEVTGDESGVIVALESDVGGRLANSDLIAGWRCVTCFDDGVAIVIGDIEDIGPSDAGQTRQRRFFVSQAKSW